VGRGTIEGGRNLGIHVCLPEAYLYTPVGGAPTDVDVAAQGKKKEGKRGIFERQSLGKQESPAKRHVRFSTSKPSKGDDERRVRTVQTVEASFATCSRSADHVMFP